MRRRTIAAWIGLTAALGTGMSLHLRSQDVVGAKPGNAVIINVRVNSAR